MPERVLVTIHLPIEMGTFSAVLKAIARHYKDARLDQSSDPQTVKVIANEGEPRPRPEPDGA